jgi:photosystem II stability/assembly factor-like uncharacterized protein
MFDPSRRAALAGAAATLAAPAFAQDLAAGHINLLEPGADSELRGLSIVKDDYWASGSKGVLYRGGKGRKLMVARPGGAQALDFRGLHAFDRDHVLAMSAGPGRASQLWRTRNGGRDWSVVVTNEDPDGFWDALVFAPDKRTGFILGDPTDGAFTLLVTLDGGATWARTPRGVIPAAAKDEAAFAASNGCLALGPKGQIAFCTGGAGRARVYLSRDGRGQRFQVLETPIPADGPTRGAFALAFGPSGELWICGGDFKDPTARGVNLAWLAPGGTEVQAVDAPAGYLSGIATTGATVLATGLAGTIVSRDGGHFERLTAQPFNVARLDGPRAGVLAGPKGAIGLWRG